MFEKFVCQVWFSIQIGQIAKIKLANTMVRFLLILIKRVNNDINLVPRAHACEWRERRYVTNKLNLCFNLRKVGNF